MSARKHLMKLVRLVLLLVFSLSACGSNADAPSTPELTSLPLEPSASPSSPRTLTVCLGSEPASLFPLGNLSSSAQAVLAAVYDGPIDSNSYGYQPVILEKLPSIGDGDAELIPVPVYVGDEVVDAEGIPVTLTAGTRIRPAGCRSDNCAIEYDGLSEVQMDQMVVNFSLLPGLEWSDGEPLTAHDSIFAYTLAANPDLPGSKYLTDRTQAYEAVDDLTVQWWGRPGYIDPTYYVNFWAPLPRHLWESYSPGELPEIDIAAVTPIGWGPFIIVEWLEGDRVILEKNANYFRAAEGLPHFDTLVFRFVPDPETALSELVAGRCDLLDPGIRLDGQVSLLQAMDGQGQLQLLVTTTPVMERIDFGIRPAEYDDGYYAGSDRADFFGDPRLRQAITLCIDRQRIVDTVTLGLSEVPGSFLPAEHPHFNPAVTSYAYDPSAADQLFEQAGWRDVDQDPATPRQAWGVSTVLNGTELALTYYTTGAAQRVQVVTIVAESLAGCGVRVEVQYFEPAGLYAPGPDGPLFGRSFDLAQFSMGNTGIEPSCAWYTSAEVPDVANYWVGTNLSGYSNPGFDAACLAVRQSIPDDAVFGQGYQETQAIFARDLPVIPLYWRLKAAAARPDLLNFSLDPTAATSLWNIESFDLAGP
ncbi:MAG: peptide ABC transporter substrate-binding protein [Anaerolineales bacterium]|nr:peptide ABC transporter substrate-binding protein [Anaerolineales bacterium]